LFDKNLFDAILHLLAAQSFPHCLFSRVVGNYTVIIPPPVSDQSQSTAAVLSSSESRTLISSNTVQNR